MHLLSELTQFYKVLLVICQVWKIQREYRFTLCFLHFNVCLSPLGILLKYRF